MTRWGRRYHYYNGFKSGGGAGGGGVGEREKAKKRRERIKWLRCRGCYVIVKSRISIILLIIIIIIVVS